MYVSKSAFRNHQKCVRGVAKVPSSMLRTNGPRSDKWCTCWSSYLRNPPVTGGERRETYSFGRGGIQFLLSTSASRSRPKVCEGCHKSQICNVDKMQGQIVYLKCSVCQCYGSPINGLLVLRVPETRKPKDDFAIPLSHFRTI